MEMMKTHLNENPASGIAALWAALHSRPGCFPGAPGLSMTVMATGVILSVVVVAGCDKASSEEVLEGKSVEAVVAANSRFAVTMYKRLVGHEQTVNGQGNLFFSPYSISTALAMTWAGANGQTEQDMGRTLGFDGVEGDVHALLGAMQKRLNDRGREGGYQLSVANALWGQQGEPFLADYLQLVERSYRAGLNQVDFIKQTEQARLTINRWVEDKTQDKIKDLIARGALDSMTRLVLTNAIYFKGDWASQFDKKATREEPFHVGPDKTVRVPMMFQKQTLAYRKFDEVEVLRLPYKGDDLSMVILLPTNPDGLAELEEELTTETLAQLMEGLHDVELEVYLPKFKMEWGAGSLQDDLAAMGMAVAFSGDADFSGMTGKRNLFISDVVHKAFVEVNEEGTEAAAATGVIMKLTAVMETPVFRADRPFVFLIKDNKVGSILFMGRVVNPQAQAK